MKPTTFTPLPNHETVRITWPTPNHHLFDAPERFFARTRANADYGKPGFTRDGGKRFHRGCDIAPITFTATGQTTRVLFTDCTTGRDFESDEPTFIPLDAVYSVFPGHVAELVTDESASDFGKHIVIEHRWPGSGEKFFTLYAHLADITVPPDGSIPLYADPIARMGQTSRIADARNWMRIAPHLHFEVHDAHGHPYDPVEFLRQFLPR